jgi:hypothetical protein
MPCIKENYTYIMYPSLNKLEIIYLNKKYI